MLLRDQLSLQLAGSTLPWAKQAQTYAFANGRAGLSTVTGTAAKTDAATAAFLNAIHGHGLQYDDVVSASSGHPGSCAVPAALALGEAQATTTGEFLDAMLCGYEVYARLGILAAPELINGGWQPHSVLSAFGAAAVAAKLWRLPEEQVTHALAIAASHCGGTSEYTSTGGTTKRVQCGIGVRAGVHAATMARAGITGPDRFLTGTKGFFEVYAGKRAEPGDMFDIDRRPCLEEIWIKPYCCCAASHAAIDAIVAAGVSPQSVDRIEVRLPTKSNRVVGSLNAHIYSPRSVTELQFSLPVQVALALQGHGNGFGVHRQIIENRIKFDYGAVLQLARKVIPVQDEALDAPFRDKWVAHTAIHLGGGARRELFVENSRGTPANPLTELELQQKFEELASAAASEAQVSALSRALAQLDPAAPLGRFTECLAIV